MSLSVIAVALVLSAEPVSPAEAAFNPEATRFDALPAPEAPKEDARVQRFLGALAGGVVGLGAGLALTATGDLASSGCFGACNTAPHIIFGALTPLFVTTGTWLGFQLAGGDGGPLTPVAALLPAAVLALALSNVAGAAGAITSLELAPFLVAASAMLIGGGALALDLRARQLEHLGNARRFAGADGGRVTLATTVATLSAGSIAGLTVLMVALGNGSGVGLVAGLVHALVGSTAVAAATWGAHRALGGKGSFGAALAGLGIGWLVALGGSALWAAQNSLSFSSFSLARATGSAMVWVELLVACAGIAPVLALEWSHTDAVTAALPRFQWSASPLPGGGGMVGALARF